MSLKYSPPAGGGKIVVKEGRAAAPERPIVAFIEGDGTGVDIWPAANRVIDAAVEKSYGGARRIEWMEILAGEKAHRETGEWLPRETVEAIAEYAVAIKGPLTTPVGGGIRSLNVALRQRLDLYACVRPVRHFRGVPAPVTDPQKLNVVIFRENTEDVYAGIEWPQGSDAVNKVISFLNNEMGQKIRLDSGIGIKPISIEGTKRLVRRAIRYAIDRGRKSVTIVHKGNIMKYTEGAFREWGYQLAAEEFSKEVVTEEQTWENPKIDVAGKVLLKNRIADSMFQQLLLRPDEYEVIATTNLNGDYLSDACAAQVGGLGMAPGANIGDTAAVFEATHGSAPKYAGQDKVNPGSLILSGAMMLEHIGWNEAADMIVRGIEKTIDAKTVTYDLHRRMKGAKLLKCSEFAGAIMDNMI